MFYKKKFLNIFIVIAFVLIFLSLINLFYKHTFFNKSKTIQLDNALFNDNILNKEKLKKLEIKNLQKVADVNLINLLSWYNNDEILLTTRDSYAYSISSFNIKNKTLNKLVNGISNENIVSPNKEKILLYENTNPKGFFNLYDVMNKTLTVINHSILHAKENFLGYFPDNSGYIFYSNNYFCKYDFNDNTKKNILEYKNINDKIVKVEISGDGQKFFIFTFNRESNLSKIDLIDLKKPNNVIKLLEGNILNFTLLDNETIIFNGKLNGAKGLYSLNINDKKSNMISNTYCFDFKLSNNKSKIAYYSINDSGIYTLYTALLNKNKLEDITEIFSDKYYIEYFQWNPSGTKLIFSVNEKYKNYSLYVAEFK